MKNGYTLIDGDERHEQNPTTFEMPDKDDRLAVPVGAYAKIGVESLGNKPGERFWVIVTEAQDGRFVGTINNDLVYTRYHGLKDTDVVEFGPEHILSFEVPRPAPRM